MTGIKEIANRFENQLDKVAGRANKKKMSRPAVDKMINKARAGYQSKLKELSRLRQQLDKLETQTQECQDSMRGHRGDLLRLTRILGTMDLADCRHVVMYDNDSMDVGYMIDGSEHHVTYNDDGEIDSQSLKEHRRSRRQDAHAADTDTYVADDNYDDDHFADVPPGIKPQTDSPEDDDNEADDEEQDQEPPQDVSDADDMEYPNFRFFN